MLGAHVAEAELLGLGGGGRCFVFFYFVLFSFMPYKFVNVPVMLKRSFYALRLYLSSFHVCEWV